MGYIRRQRITVYEESVACVQLLNHNTITDAQRLFIAVAFVLKCCICCL